MLCFCGTNTYRADSSQNSIEDSGSLSSVSRSPIPGEAGTTSYPSVKQTPFMPTAFPPDDGGGLIPIPVFGTYAIVTPRALDQVVWTIEPNDNVFLVDYDQTLNACDKNDDFAADLDWKNQHSKAGLQNVMFLHEHDQAHILNYDIKKKIEEFRSTRPNPKVFIWTARSLEMLADIQILLKSYKIAELFDGIICCDGRKKKAIEFIEKQTRAENIFVIDNSIRNCREAREILPSENVELYIGENLEQLRKQNEKLRRRNSQISIDYKVMRTTCSVACILLGAVIVQKAIHRFKK